MAIRLGERDDRVDEHGKVGPTALAVDGVGGVRLPGVEVRGDGRGEVSAGGEAEDADVLRIDAPLGRFRSDETHGALRVVHRRRVAVAVAAVAISQNETRHAERIEPLRDLMTLVIHGQPAVTAAGADHDARAGRAVGLRQIDRQRRGVLGVALGVGGAVGPERHGRGLGGTCRRSGGE